MPTDESLRIGLWLCDVLTYLHGQSPPVIHRDLKPGNVILGRGNRRFLIDFSIARRYTQCATGVLLAPSPRQAQGLDTVYNVGSRGYAPREQYGPKASTSPGTDIYGLGGLLHYLFSGRDPATVPDEQLFSFAPLHHLASLPGGASLAARIAQMTDDNPARRPDIDTVRETLEACSSELSSLPVIGTPASGQGSIPPSVARAEADWVHAG